jgi:hypothetical protein
VIFFQRKFVDSVFFYYRLLCVYYLHSTFLITQHIPRALYTHPGIYHETIHTYYSSIFDMIYGLSTIFLFHFEETLQMAILLTRMKMFSPFVDKYFTAKPQIVSLAFFHTCFLIELPLEFAFKRASFVTYSSPVLIQRK